MNIKLEDTEIQTRLTELSDWTIENGQLARKFSFSSYGAGVAFAVQVVLLAEKMDHHPDSLEITWKAVRVAYFTHSAGGLTALDFEAAARVSKL
jgi:4a-hydroxytetrahydrobiopterin dehydratase